jgi:hypothetical protein
MSCCEDVSPRYGLGKIQIGGGAGGNGNYTKDNVTISELSNGGGSGSYSMIGTFDSIIANNNGNGSVTITYKS